MDLLKELQGAKKIGISGHVRPDGDCVGSCLALKKYIENAMPDSEVKLFLEQPPVIFSFLYGFDSVDSTYGGIVNMSGNQSANSNGIIEVNEAAEILDADKFDVYIALDSGSIDRLGNSIAYFKTAAKTICIDHHESNLGYADINEIDAEASSTCEILTRFMAREFMDIDIAKAIYTGIVHDTGVFQYTCMKKATFKIVGELVEYGFDTQKIINDTFYEKTYVQNQILGRALLESILFMDGKCIASCVDRRMMEFYGAKTSDFEGIVNQMLLTKDVEVSIFMYEIRTQEYKVSMRSKGKVNLAEIAVLFGGGGHQRAAGCNMMGTYRDVLNNISKEIEKRLN